MSLNKEIVDGKTFFHAREGVVARQAAAARGSCHWG